MPAPPKTSKFVVELSDGVFSAIAQKARVRAKDRHVYPLHVGDTYLEPPACARAESLGSTSNLFDPTNSGGQKLNLYSYSPVQGEEVLLAAAKDFVFRRSGISLEAAHLQIVSGATAGLSIVTESLLDPGDEVLLPSPYWPLIRGIIKKRGAVPIEVPLFDRLDGLAGREELDLEATLARAITPKTTAIYINSPNNPTGATLSESQLAIVGAIAEKHNLWIFCDEVYEDLWHHQRPAPTWSRPDFIERAVAVHSVSKAYGLAGARVGFVHGPASAMAAIRSVQTFSTYCAPKIMQLGAANVLTESDGWLVETRLKVAAAAKMASAQLFVPAPTAGTFLFIDISRLLRTGEDTLGFLERCLDVGVLLTPGSSCGQAHQASVRLCFTCVPPAELQAALQALAPLFTDFG